MSKAGDVILAFAQFTDSNEVKQRPAVILFEELGNIVVAGVTSNPAMKGIPLLKKEGAVKDSVIKTNYLFTVSNALIRKKLFSLTKEKRRRVFQDLSGKLSVLNK